MAYKAGTWGSATIYSDETWNYWESKPGENWQSYGYFDGYEAGTDKGISIGSYRYESWSKSSLNGWRVLKKEGSGSSGTVTLISAGSPAVFYPSTSPSTEVSRLNEFCNKMFVNGDFASKSRSVSISAEPDGYNDFGVLWNSPFYETLSSEYFWVTSWTNKLYYFHGSSYQDYATTNGSFINYHRYPYGVHPVVVLKQGITCSSSASESYLGQNCYSIYKP